MVRLSQSFLIALIITGVFLPGVVSPQSVEDWTAVSLVRSERTVLRSSLVDRVFEIQVALPESYDESPQSEYPVLYVLDGNLAFPLVESIYNILREGPAIEEMIVVGIGYPRDVEQDISHLRFADLTPSNFAAADEVVGQPLPELASGQGIQFIEMLKTQVFPLIEARYRSDGRRGLLGHSAGGLLVAHIMFKETGLFSHYLISSPSLWWNSLEIMDTESGFFQGSDTLAVAAYLSVGGSENENQLPPFRQFVDTLTSRDYREFDWDYRIYENESHMSVVPHAISDGLEFLFVEEE